MTIETAPAQILSHLRGGVTPFALRRVEPAPVLGDEDLHRAAFERDPELYALLGLAPRVAAAQRARALFVLLGASRKDLNGATRALTAEVTSLLLAGLPAGDVLTVFLALRRVRANHKHVTRAILRYILEHPCLPDLAARRRPALIDCLEHAVGKAAMRASARMLGEGPANEGYLRSHLLRFLVDEKAARAVVPYLYGYVATAGTSEPYDHVHEPFAAMLDAVKEDPKTVTPTNRGELAAALYHGYRGGQTAEILAAAEELADRLVSKLPRFNGTVALVYDASASTRGYGEREWACASQSLAFRMAMERCCDRLLVFQVGQYGATPVPEGPTDLAGPLLAALAATPDLVVIVTDGYENAAEGDLARVAEALPRVGVQTPVAFCHSTFSAADDLTLRCPAPALPGFGFWHENDFEDVLLSMFALVENASGRESVRAALRARLDRMKKEASAWIALN